MVKQYSENQYDDDLTLGSDDYDDSYYSDADDLFEFGTDSASPISRLKSLVLSIDWEITDDVLRQFNEELVDLKSIWAGETINLVYVQALEKISKYIYQKKAESHPSSIKLLLTFYYNLEKIVSSSDLREEEKKEILLEDVKRFENFKRQIRGQSSSPAPITPEIVATPLPSKTTQVVTGESELLNLKAIVLGIDWEITEQDLNDLRKEVFQLEEKYSDSRPKLILLQGIGTLAAYIKVKRSNAHPDAFKVLQHFYECLENLVKRPMSLEEEKAILFPAVEKFNAFKSLLGPTIAPEATAPATEQDDEEDDDAFAEDGPLSPALADVTEDAEVGFQAEREALALGLQDPGAVTSHIDDFFGETEASPVQLPQERQVEPQEGMAAPVMDLFADEEPAETVDRGAALQGVDVGDDDEETVELGAGQLSFDGSSPVESPSPTNVVEALVDSEEVAVLTDTVEGEIATTEEEILGVTESIFPDAIEESPEIGEVSLPVADREAALLGVNVETEADDDSDELSLPMEGEELAPALASSEEESLFSATSLERPALLPEEDKEIAGTLDSLFLDEAGPPAMVSHAPEAAEVPPALQPADETEELAPALAWLDEEEQRPAEHGVEVAAFASDDLFADADQSHRDAEVPLEPESGDLAIAGGAPSDQENLEEPQTVGLDTEDAVAAFFAEKEVASDVAMDEGDIEDLFDNLENDLANQKTEDLAVDIEAVELEQDVSRFFATADDHDEIDTSQTGVSTGAIEVTPLVDGQGQSSPLAAQEDQPAEVVFELVEEEPEDLFGATAVALDSDIEQFSLDQAESDGTDIEDFVEEQPSEEFASSLILPVEPITPQGPLAGLRSCIESLQLELSDKILNTLFSEINGLRQKWADRPLEKTFLQLLSTVTQHIDSYRYESSAEAHGLLVVIAEGLEGVAESDSKTNQEMLLAATLRVLDWQQGMLSRQAVRVGEQLTFVDPLRTAGREATDGDAQVAFDSLIDQLEEGEATGTLGSDFEVQPNERTEVSEVESKQGMAPGQGVAISDALADDLKKEIAGLRQTLQMEIAELRRELKREA